MSSNEEEASLEDQTSGLDWDAAGISMEVDRYSSLVFISTARRRGLPRMYSVRRSIGPGSAEALSEMLEGAAFLSRSEGEIRAILDRGDLLLFVDIGNRIAHVMVASVEGSSAERAAEEVLDALPQPEPPEVRTPFSFWSESQGEGFLVHRSLEPQKWDDIADGYAGPVRAALEELMARESAPSGGRLILWHGEPGTGKTHALRALAHAWRGWCGVHFITDPDRFVGERMSYPLSVLTSNVHALMDCSHRLLVLEDAGELLAPDARRQTGPGLSRLLNLTDGLLGAGMNAITLVTTNEPLGRLHPAVHRPGRRLAEIEFTALDVDEASAWLERRGCTELVTEPKTIAQLYAILEGRSEGARRTPVGFG